MSGSESGVDSLGEFVERKAALEMILEIGSANEVHFTELFEELDISRVTLTKRLREGEDIGILRPIPGEGGRGKVNKYQLTPIGARVHWYMIREEVRKTYDILKTYRQRFAEETAEVREWVQNNEDAIRYAEGEMAERIKDLESQFDDEDLLPGSSQFYSQNPDEE